MNMYAFFTVGAVDSHFWIGGKRQSGIWKWDGVNQGNIGSVADWSPFEPNNVGGDENCIETRYGEWNDLDCGARFKFICERSLS